MVAIKVHVLNYAHFCKNYFVVQARQVIAMLAQDFISDGCTILVHGYSRVVLEALRLAVERKKLFRVFCTGFFSETFNLT